MKRITVSIDGKIIQTLEALPWGRSSVSFDWLDGERVRQGEIILDNDSSDVILATGPTADEGGSFLTGSEAEAPTTNKEK